MKREPKEPQFVSSSDHEDWENEYYARRSSGGIIGALFMLSAVVLMVVYAIINAIIS
jgi:hypothetical protein